MERTLVLCREPQTFNSREGYWESQDYWRVYTEPLRYESSQRSAWENHETQNRGSHWSFGNVLLDWQAHPALAKARSVRLQVPQTLRSISIYYRMHSPIWIVLTELEILSQDDVNVYKSMSPMPDIDRPSHTLLSAHQPPKISWTSCDPVSEEEDEGTDDDCILVEVIRRKKKTSTARGGASSPSGGLFTSHPKEARVTTRKCKARASRVVMKTKHPSKCFSWTCKCFYLLILIDFSPFPESSMLVPQTPSSQSKGSGK
jgi:hypothetical protein